MKRLLFGLAAVALLVACAPSATVPVPQVPAAAQPVRKPEYAGRVLGISEVFQEGPVTVHAYACDDGRVVTVLCDQRPLTPEQRREDPVTRAWARLCDYVAVRSVLVPLTNDRVAWNLTLEDGGYIGFVADLNNLPGGVTKARATQ